MAAAPPAVPCKNVRLFRSCFIGMLSERQQGNARIHSGVPRGFAPPRHTNAHTLSGGPVTTGNPTGHMNRAIGSLPGDAEQMPLTADEQPIQGGDRGGNHPILHIILGEQLKPIFNPRHKDHAIFTRGVQFAARDQR